MDEEFINEIKLLGYILSFYLQCNITHVSNSDYYNTHYLVLEHYSGQDNWQLRFFCRFLYRPIYRILPERIKWMKSVLNGLGKLSQNFSQTEQMD